MLSIVLFGSPQLCRDQRPLPLTRRKNRALVYYLAAQPEPVRRERLLTLLWPDHERPVAQHNLRTMLHGLRETLGPTLIVTDDALALAPETEVDVRRFLAVRVPLGAEPHHLEATLALYQGDFLADFSLPDCPAFDDWVTAERERYRQLAVHGLTALAQGHAARGAWPAALAAITRAVDLDPLREDVQSVAMQLQYFAGDRTGAIRRYEQLRKLLDDELGLPPMAETRAVYDAIITERLQPEAAVPAVAEPEAPRPAPPPDVSLPPVVPPQPEPAVHAAPILATKLYLPRPRAELVSRPRLLARLGRGLSGPLTLIAAPAGFGKTTILADWLNHADYAHQHVAWLGLDAGDSDPVQFLRYLVAALQTLEPSVGSSLLPILQSAQTPSLETLMPSLVQDLLTLPEESILVLDDYHVIDTPAVHQALGFLLDHLPPQLHLVIATRSDPPLPLPRLRARGQLTELRAADLRFTVDEAAAFLREVMGLPLTAADVGALESRTEGWIAGLQLAALSLRDRSGTQQAEFIDAFAGSHRFVVDYLVDEVLARQPAHRQTFLLRTSILDRMSGALCDVVVGGQGSMVGGQWAGTTSESASPIQNPASEIQHLHSQAVLEELERANLFIVPLDDMRRWYRYHHLFAQVLRERLIGSASTDAVAGLHGRAAAWFEQQGLSVEAVQHALAARDWDHAAHLIEARGLVLILRGQVHSVQNWLDTLPATLLSARPHLLLLRGLTLFFTNRLEDAGLHMQAVEEALAAELDERSRTVLGYAVGTRAAIAHFRGDPASCIALAQEALEILPASDVSGRISCNLHIAAALLMSGDVTGANEHRLVASVATARTLGDPVSLFNGLTLLARLRRRGGRLRQSAVTYREAAEVVPEPSALRAMLNSGTYYFGLGDLLREWNELDAAEELLVQGQALVRENLLIAADAMVAGYIALARLYQSRGTSSAAAATLDDLDVLLVAGNYPAHLRARAGAARAHLALMRGDFRQAEQWALTNALALDDELSYLHEQEHLTYARVNLARGRSEPAGMYLRDALHLLRRMLAQAEVEGQIGSVIELLVLQGLALHAQGDHGPALAAVQRGLVLAAPEGYVRVFVDEGRPMATLLAQVMRIGADGWAPGTIAQSADARQHAERLVGVFQAEGVITEVNWDRPTPAFQLPVPPLLTERELDVLRLLAAGHSNRTIAEALIVAVGTVKRHVSNIMEKLHAESRLEAVARARDLDLL